MKNYRKTTAFLIALVLIFSSMTACSSSKNTTSDPGDTPADVAVSAEETEKEVNPLEELPQADFGGSSFLILEDTNAIWFLSSLYSEELNGEIINDTIYERNAYVEELYNVDISLLGSNEIPNLIQNSVTSGTHEYDMVWERISDLFFIAERGHILNLKDFDAFNFEGEWWDHSSIDAFTITGRLFFACNDIDTHAIEGSSAMYFSKSLINAFELENPYTLVRDYKWTLDKMGSMMETVSSDSNGDGTRSEGDTFGLVTGVGQYLALLNGAGLTLIQSEDKDGDTKFILNTASEEVISVSDKIGSLLNNKNYTVIVNDDGWGHNAFYTDHSLFYILQLGSIAGIRDNMENDFGVIPLPMQMEEQGYYTTNMESTVHAMCFPQTLPDKTKSGLVAEAMAVYSSMYLNDAYYETTLKGKIARDTDTTEMLDIITATRTYDFSTCYYSWGVYDQYRNTVQANGAEGLASMTASMQTAFDANAERTVEAFRSVP